MMKFKTSYSYQARKNIIALLLLLVSFIEGVAGQQDSLRTLLKSASLHDTAKVVVLVRLAGYYQETQPDSMIIIASEGLALANRINFDKGKAMCLSQIGTAYLFGNDYDKALSYYRDALRIYEKNGSGTGKSAAFHNIANTYYRLSKYQLAIDYYNKSKEVSEQINDPASAALELAGMANVYSDMGNYTEALKYYLDGLRIQEKMDDRPAIAGTLSNIATLYTLTKEYKKALDYSYQSMAIFEEMGYKSGIVSNLVNIASVYGELKDYNRVVAMLSKGLLIADSMGDNYWKNMCMNNMAEAYYNMGNYDNAFPKYLSALTEGEKIKDPSVIAMAQSGIGRVLVKKGQFSEGVEHLLIAFDIVQQNGMKEPMFETARDLSEAYEKMKDYPHALAYHKIYYDLRDSLYNEKNDKRVQQLQFDYELEKKESQIALLNTNKIIAQEKSERQKVMVWALLAGIGLLSAIAVLLYRSRRSEQKSGRKMLIQKEEIQQQANRLEELNKFKDKTFSVLSHDLRGPINAFTSTMSMLDEKIISHEEFTLLKPEVNKQLGSLNILLDNLLNWAKSYMKGEMAAKPGPVNLYELAARNINLMQDTASQKQIVLRNKIPAGTIALCDPEQLDIVLRNLVSNALKFTRRNGTVTVSATANAGKVKLSVADTGIGMTKDQLYKLFMIAPDNNTYGTDGEKGMGLGLLLCFEFIKVNNGTITVTSEVNEGSTFNVLLPAATNVSA